MFNGSVVGQYIYGGILTSAISFGGWLVLFPLRSLITKLKAEWGSKGAILVDMQREMTLQRTNCLSTLQQQGSKQIELLEKTNQTLEAIHLGQSEMSGYIKGARRIDA
jgi:hypothetical protein